jgi:CDP-2,3-bis-(O-geranylgeranyl)-sn-glycerol synthase
MTILLFILKCLWFILPAGFANMAPVFAKRHFAFLARPVDFNKKINNKPILGQSKTWRGLIFGIIAALIVFAIQKWLYQFFLFQQISLINYDNYNLFLGFILGAGALFGDLVESFFKRRLNIPAGEPWFIFDQMDWILGTLFLSSFFYIFSWQEILVILVLGLISHPLINYLGFLLKLKENKF